MGGVTGVTNVIARGFQINESLIELYKANDNFIPRDKDSKHTFLHDFGNTWWEKNYQLAFDTLKKNMEESILKYKYLGKKTDNILKSSQNVALVYYGFASESEWENLQKIIFNRYKKNIPIINILELKEKKQVCDHLYTAYVNDNQSPKRGQIDEWTGWDESWNSAFKSVIMTYN